MQKAEKLEEADDFLTAADQYTEALRVDPENGGAYYQRGRCYLRLEDYATAISDFEEAKRRDATQYGTHPEFAEAYLERGTQHFEGGEWQKAESDFTQALAHDPRDGRLFSRRGATRFMLEDHEGALDDFDAAIAIDNDPSDYMRRGRVLQKLGRLDDAIADFEEAGRLDPQNALAHYRRGDCYLEKDDVEQAILALSEAIRIATRTPDPDFSLADAYGVRGLCQMRAERFDKAADDFTQAIRRSRPDVASFHESRAICYEMLGRLEPARFDRLIMSCLVRIERDPNDHETHNALAYYLATCPEPDVRDGEMAVKHATKACELTSWQEAEYIDTLASACAEAGQFDKAVEWAQKAIELAPDEEARDRFHAALELYQAGKPNHKSLPE
jgi:tetratricopeptide (TPR) repeat protein